MSLQTLNDILLVVCKNRRERVMLQKRASGWVPISSAEIYRNVVGVARAPESWGIDHGDRVAILSENRPEWTITDFAALALGAVTVPIYSTQTADQTSYILNDSGARVIAVSTKSQLEKILAIQRHTPLERIIVMDAVETAHAVHMQRLMLPGPPGLDPEIGDAPFDARSRVDSARRPCYHHLHLRHDRHSEGGDADPRQHGVEHRMLRWRDSASAPKKK